MRIHRVEFRNFRSFTSFDLDLDGRSVWVIGENAGGKTSLLTGIAQALGRDLAFASADFADLQQPIELRVTLTDLDAPQRAIFGNYALFGAGAPALQVQARAVWDPIAEEAEVEHGYPRQAQSRSTREERDAIPLQWLPSGRDAARMLQFDVARDSLAELLSDAAHDPGTILLVDEPEISLDPQSQGALMRALLSLDSQMLVATHSANLLDRVDPRTVVRLRRTRAGIEKASPSGLSNDDVRRLSRFTSPQTAEAFLARAVVLVEGISDQVALEALAERRGRNLDAEGISIVPIGGAKTIGSFLDLFGPQGFGVRLAGLCDAAEEGDFQRGLERAGLGSNLTRADMESLGFYVCVADLEDELIRALGAASVEQVVDAQGELGSFRTFQKQPAQQGKTNEEQLRRFMGTRGGRKIEYAPLLVEALDLTQVPRPLDRVLAHV